MWYNNDSKVYYNKLRMHMIILKQLLQYKEKQSQKANTGDEMKSPQILGNSKNARQGEKKG